MSILSIIESALRQKLNPSILTSTPVSGGSINKAFKISTEKDVFFCKVNSATKFPQLLSKEVSGLNFIAKHGIKTPRVIDCFEESDHQVLVMDWVSPAGKTEIFWQRFGERLAHLHSIPNDHFGFSEWNYMGSVKQNNEWNQEWIPFFIQHRLQPMLKLCFEKQLLKNIHEMKFEKLYSRLDKIFPPSKPSLVHGDLWRGNFLCDQDQEPVLIDPAVYFGHRSIDLGMTRLFGGFSPIFYQAYHYHNAMPPNYEEQEMVCNLYPLLIHLLLFGKSYLLQIENTLDHFG